MPWHQIRTDCAALRHLQTGSCPQQRSSCQSTLLQTHRSFSYTLALTSRQIDGRDTHPVRRCREERVFRMTDLFEIQGGIVKGNELHFWQPRTVETTIVCFCVEMLLWICVTLAGQSQLWIVCRAVVTRCDAASFQCRDFFSVLPGLCFIRYWIYSAF